MKKTLLALSLAALTPSAHADPLTYTFTGTIEAIAPYFADEAISVTFNVDSNRPTYPPETYDRRAFYAGAVTGGALHIGSQTWTITNQYDVNYNHLSVSNDVPIGHAPPVVDTFFITGFVVGPQVDGHNPWIVQLFMSNEVDSPNNALTSLAMPTALDADAFNAFYSFKGMTFALDNNVNIHSYHFTGGSVAPADTVPEPATLALLGLGLAGLGFSRRK